MTTEQAEQEASSSLEAHRAAILLRSVLIGSVTLVPGVGDLLVGTLQRGLLRHVAGLSHIQLEDKAADELCTMTATTQRLSAVSILGVVATILKRSVRLRRFVAGLALLKGIEETSRAFHVATMLDHFCAHHSVGTSIGVGEARRIREAAEAAVLETQREVAGAVLDGVVKHSLQVLRAVPTWVLAKLGRSAAEQARPALEDLRREAKAAISSASAKKYMSRLIEKFDSKLLPSGA